MPFGSIYLIILTKSTETFLPHSTLLFLGSLLPNLRSTPPTPWLVHTMSDKQVCNLPLFHPSTSYQSIKYQNTSLQNPTPNLVLMIPHSQIPMAKLCAESDCDRQTRSIRVNQSHHQSTSQLPRQFVHADPAQPELPSAIAPSQP